MSLEVPTWYKQRQGKTELVGERIYRLFGPNLPESYIGIRPAENGRWQGFLRDSADGADVAATESKFTTEYEAWQVSFEMYRETTII